MVRAYRSGAALLLLCAFAGPSFAAPQGLHAGGASAEGPSPLLDVAPETVAAGRTLFRTHCARCHGMRGEGGEGPSLKRARLRHAATDEALVELIARGIPGTGMAGTWLIDEGDRWRLAAYVRSLGALPEEPLPGDPARGAALFVADGGCQACHIVAGSGRGVGPELTAVGLRRSADYLRRALTEPAAAHPMVADPVSGRLNAYLSVALVTGDGVAIEGLRIREDEFTVQLRDREGRIHSFEKATLQRYDKVFSHSMMPAYERSLDSDEVNDLVAYLMTRTGTEARP